MRFVRKREAARMIGVSPCQLMRYVRDPHYAAMGFPKPVQIGHQSIGFVEAELKAWMEKRIKDREAAIAMLVEGKLQT